MAKKHLGPPGQMVGDSKSRYQIAHKGNLVVFNANVCTEKEKIWYGDLDLTVSEEKLVSLSEEIGEDIYVLKEMDGRFNNEENPKLESAILVADEYGGVLGVDNKNYFFRNEEGRWKRKRNE